MYQEIIDGLILPNPELVRGFFTQDDWFYIDLADNEPCPAFELTESLRRSEFVRICKMITDKLLSV
jgi:hypothetical protein